MYVYMFDIEMNTFYSNHTFPPKGKELMISFSGDTGARRHCQYPYILSGISFGEHCSTPQLSITSLSLPGSLLWPVGPTASHPYPRRPEPVTNRGAELPWLPHPLWDDSEACPPLWLPGFPMGTKSHLPGVETCLVMCPVWPPSILSLFLFSSLYIFWKIKLPNLVSLSKNSPCICIFLSQGLLL